jgi:heme A synthase
MAIGTSLLALGPVLNLASRYLGDWFDSILPPPEDQPWLNPFSIAMQVAISAIAILAIVYMARGLVEARQYEDRPGMRRWWVLVVVVALVGSGLGLAVFGAISSDVEESTFVASYLLSLLSIAINAVTVYAWAYFTGTAIAGRRAGEDPNLGWFLAAFAGACILALFLGSGVQSMLAYLMQVNISTDVSVVLSVLPEIAYLALLAAFALRLPTTHAPVDDVEDEAGVPGSGDPAPAIAAPDDLAGSTA